MKIIKYFSQVNNSIKECITEIRELRMFSEIRRGSKESDEMIKNYYWYLGLHKSYF